MKLTFTRLLFAMGLGVLAPTPATSAVHAAAQLSNFTLSLIDLDPADGLSPAVAVVSAGNFSELSNTVFFGSVSSQSRLLRGITPFDALAANLTVSTVASFASIVGGAAEAPWQGALLQAEGWLFNLPGSGVAAPLRYFSAGITASSSDAGAAFFLLGPYSAITMSATAQVTVSKDFAAPVGSTVGEAVVASAGLELSRPFVDNGMTVIERIDLNDAGQMLTRSATVTAAIYNHSANSIPVALRAFVGIDGTSQIAAVPEPKTWALWAAGLATMLALRRRRGGQRDPLFSLSQTHRS